MTRENGVYDDPHPPTLLSKDGGPFEGEALVEFISAGAPIHFFIGKHAAKGDARIVAWFCLVDFGGLELPRYYPVICQCDKPALNTECKRWKPKGRSSSLYGDAAVALGRLPKNGEKLVPSKLFPGKLFREEVVVVETDRNGKPLPGPRWHSRLGSLVSLVAGGGTSPPSSSSSSTSSNSNPSSHPIPDAFPVPKTTPIPTTKDGNEDPY
jgi:hypothetical protein